MQIDKNTRIYVAGAGGMLGEAVYEHFSPIATVEASDIDTNTPWLTFGDVRDFSAMEKLIKAFRPNLIINLAALTDLEQCEKEIDNAWATNALGAENMGLIAQRMDVTYVYISTAGIFGGEKEVYTDYDAPNPLSYYAKSKYYGENYVRNSITKHFVLRAGWMMGGGPQKDKKFINKLFKQIQSGQKTLHVVDDKLGTPTYTVDFARGIHSLVESELFGLYNHVCKGSASRYDVAVEFIRLLKLEKTIKIEKVASEFFAAEYFAPRPASEKLVTPKLDARGLNVMRDWKTCLREYVGRYRDVLKIV
jgi:dTDP-4-dehydrorhamnose reductase